MDIKRDGQLTSWKRFAPDLIRKNNYPEKTTEEAGSGLLFNILRVYRHLPTALQAFPPSAFANFSWNQFQVKQELES